MGLPHTESKPGRADDVGVVTPQVIEPPELVLLEEMLDIDMIECGLFALLQRSVTGPAIELRNLGAAERRLIVF